MASLTLYIEYIYILPPPQCTCAEFSSFYSGNRVAIEWLSSGYRVAIEWLSSDGQQAATIPAEICFADEGNGKGPGMQGNWLGYCEARSAMKSDM